MRPQQFAAEYGNRARAHQTSGFRRTLRALPGNRLYYARTLPRHRVLASYFAFLLKNLRPRERSPHFGRHWSARAGAAALHYHRLALDRRERSAQAGYPRAHVLCGAEIDHHDMIIRIENQLVKRREQVGLPAAAEATLENGKLHPFAITFHQREHAPPALGVPDIVRHDV